METLPSRKMKREMKFSSRFIWLDQFRGLVVILFIIADISWRYPYTATFLMHGWDFYDPGAGLAQMITNIDIGQQIFLFMVGFTGALSFYNYLKNNYEKFPIFPVLRRGLVLLLLAFLYDGLMWHDFGFENWDFLWVFAEGTFSTIFISWLLAILLLWLTKYKPDIRVGIAFAIMVLHGVLYFFPIIRNQPWIAWNTFNHIAITIWGTCAYDWWFNFKDENPEGGIKKRVLPSAVLSFVLCYLINFLQPANHSDATIALSLLAVGTSQFLMYIFYNFDKYEFRIPMLSEFGKNVLLMILLTATQSLYLDLMPESLLLQYRILTLAWIGILPILVLYLIAWILAKLKLTIKL